MSYIKVVMPLSRFYPYVKDVVDKEGGHFYVERKLEDGKISNIKLDENNLDIDIIKNREKNLLFYISIINRSNINFYDSPHNDETIEGRGGRETENAIELISIRLISRSPSKKIKKIFNNIKKKLKDDQQIGLGVKSKSSIYRNYFYLAEEANNKLFKFDFNNESLPDIEIL